MNPGDLFLLPDPGYPDYLSGAALGQVEYATVPLKAENNFLPDLAAIPAATARRAKFFYVNYPNNPTGAVATREFYEELVAWAKQYEVGIISDFAYGALGYDGNRPISFMEIPGAKEVGIEFYTYSKTFNMAGWRIAFAVGNADIIEALNLIQDHLFVSLFPAPPVRRDRCLARSSAGRSDSSLGRSVPDAPGCLFDGCPQRLAGTALLPRGPFTLGCRPHLR